MLEGGGGLFPVGFSIHTVEQPAGVIGVQSTMHGEENSELRALQAKHATEEQWLTRQLVH